MDRSSIRPPPIAAAFALVGGADRDAFREDVMAGVRRPTQEPFYRRWLAEISCPDARPSFSAMISDEEGFVWVRPSVPAEAEDVAWTVYGSDGQAAATMPMPAQFEVLDVDATHVLAGWKDDFDVECVSSYRIVR